MRNCPKLARKNEWNNDANINALETPIIRQANQSLSYACDIWFSNLKASCRLDLASSTNSFEAKKWPLICPCGSRRERMRRNYCYLHYYTSPRPRPILELTEPSCGQGTYLLFRFPKAVVALPNDSLAPQFTMVG